MSEADTAAPTVQIHGTAIVTGTTGLVFIGPSGSGKSAAALHCIAAAQRRGQFSALIADDRTTVSSAGGRMIARCPPTIGGLLEIRGAGIVCVPFVESAVLHYAVSPLRPPFWERMPPEAETFEPLAGHILPLLRLPVADGLDCYDTLTVLMQNRPLSTDS